MNQWTVFLIDVFESPARQKHSAAAHDDNVLIEERAVAKPNRKIGAELLAAFRGFVENPVTMIVSGAP